MPFECGCIRNSCGYLSSFAANENGFGRWLRVSFLLKGLFQKVWNMNLKGPSSATYPQLSGCLANIQTPHIHISIRCEAHLLHPDCSSFPIQVPSILISKCRTIPFQLVQLCDIFWNQKMLLPCFFFFSFSRKVTLAIWGFLHFPMNFRFLTIFCKKWSEDSMILKEGSWYSFRKCLANTLEKETTTHFSIFAWEMPWTEKPGRLQFMVLQRVRHGWATNSSNN